MGRWSGISHVLPTAVRLTALACPSPSFQPACDVLEVPFFLNTHPNAHAPLLDVDAMFVLLSWP